MEELFKQAHVLYPKHEMITSEEFRITKTLYFYRLRKQDYHGRILLFRNTFSSVGNVTRMLYNSYIYFALSSNPGSIQECYYYGKQKVL